MDFTYVPGSGPNAVAEALDFLTEIGPASSVLRSLAQISADILALEQETEGLLSEITGGTAA